VQFERRTEVSAQARLLRPDNEGGFRSRRHSRPTNPPAGRAGQRPGSGRPGLTAGAHPRRFSSVSLRFSWERVQSCAWKREGRSCSFPFEASLSHFQQGESIMPPGAIRAGRSTRPERGRAAQGPAITSQNDTFASIMNTRNLVWEQARRHRLRWTVNGSIGNFFASKRVSMRTDRSCSFES
jgi:hypothetical protein